MKLNIENIIHSTVAQVIGTYSSDLNVEALLIDSRSQYFTEGVIFCALTTESSDGHRYISDMYRKGVRLFLVERVPEILAGMVDAIFLVVDSVEIAIYNIAQIWRKRLDNVRFIGVTGSVGKTIVKELLYQTLLNECDVARSPRSWNSRIGVPLSICEVSTESDLAIIEVGIDRIGDMSKLGELVCPEIGIFMPITDEHDAGFESKEQKIFEKAKLFGNCKFVVYDSSEPIIGKYLEQLTHDARIVGINACNKEQFNKCVVEAVAEYLGLSYNDIPEINVLKNRIDVNEGVNDCIMLYDGFTNDYRSLVSALDFMRRRMTPTRRNTVVMTDMLHSNDVNDIASYYTKVTKLLETFGIDRVIGIGEEIYHNKSSFTSTMNIETVDSIDMFLKTYDINRFSSETILIFGKPTKQLESIRSHLETPRHDTILEVNLNSIVHNFNYYRSLLKPTTGMIAMVKASAYGVGAVEISKTLQAQGAAYLAVAVVDEGVELRRGGITMPIVVLNPITGNYKALFDYNLEPSVFSMRELETLLTEAKRCGVDKFKAHIKLDTGMHRVGFLEEELPQLINRLNESDHIHIASVFSHLATADCLDQDSYTEEQLITFDRMSSRLIKELPYRIMRHILNTAGIMRFGEYQYDMVRLGIGLYGISPLPQKERNLAVVASLHSTIISIKKWEAGTTIGYGRRGVLNRDSVIATIPVGYADGIDRHLGNGAANFVVGGILCPTIGNICMDQCMIDVTDVHNVTIGDSVEIFGMSMPVETLAETLTTIPYEILTSVSPRVRRIYYRD